MQPMQIEESSALPSSSKDNHAWSSLMLGGALHDPRTKMMLTGYLILVLVFIAVLASTSASTSVQQPYNIIPDNAVQLGDGIMYEILENIDISEKQGGSSGSLSYGDDGYLYESGTDYADSHVRRLDPSSGEILEEARFDGVAHGVAFYERSIVQLAIRSTVPTDLIPNFPSLGITSHYFVLKWDAESMTEEPNTSAYETSGGNKNGMAIAYDKTRNEIVTSNRGHELEYRDPDRLEIIRRIAVVRHNGKPASNLVDLEIWNNKVLAVVQLEEVLLVVDPQTGSVEHEYDLSYLGPNNGTHLETSYDLYPPLAYLTGVTKAKEPTELYVSGKHWNVIYRIKLLTKN